MIYPNPVWLWEYLRRYTHHLFVVFYVLMCVHGYSGFVMKQTNFDTVPSFEHQPDQSACCDRADTRSDTESQCNALQHVVDMR